MGTRADFYVGRGEQAEWLGSIAWDGDPESIKAAVLLAESEEEYRAAVSAFLLEDESATVPADGWPWAWDNSRTTDYAYAFDRGQVWCTYFGWAWFPATSPEPDIGEIPEKQCIFPNMTAIRNVTRGERSGVTVFSVRVPT